MICDLFLQLKNYAIALSFACQAFYALSFACPKERAKEKGPGNDIQPLPDVLLGFCTTVVKSLSTLISDINRSG